MFCYVVMIVVGCRANKEGEGQFHRLNKYKGQVFIEDGIYLVSLYQWPSVGGLGPDLYCIMELRVSSFLFGFKNKTKQNHNHHHPTHTRTILDKHLSDILSCFVYACRSFGQYKLLQYLCILDEQIIFYWAVCLR